MSSPHPPSPAKSPATPSSQPSSSSPAAPVLSPVFVSNPLFGMDSSPTAAHPAAPAAGSSKPPSPSSESPNHIDIPTSTDAIAAGNSSGTLASTLTHSSSSSSSPTTVSRKATTRSTTSKAKSISGRRDELLRSLAEGNAAEILNAHESLDRVGTKALARGNTNSTVSGDAAGRRLLDDDPQSRKSKSSNHTARSIPRPPPSDESARAAAGAGAGAGALDGGLTWLQSRKSKNRFPEPPALTEEDESRLREQGRVAPSDGAQPRSVLARALARLDFGPKPPPKDLSITDRMKMDTSLTPDEVIAAMRSEAIVQAKIRQRRCWFWACVGTWGVIIALLVIIIPVFIKVIIPWMITDGFAHGTSKSASPIQVQVVGLSNFTAAGATGNFSAYANGVGVPLNIPIHMMPGSYWNFRVLEAANGSQPAGWTDMVTMGDYVGDAWIRDNVVSTTSSGFDIAVAGGGKALAALVAGLSQVFIKGASAVPTMNINIIADFMVGSLFYPKLNLARSVNIGEWLTVATFTGPTTGPTANVQASSFAFQPDGSILTGLSINLPPTTPTPLGFNLTQIKFNLTLDERTLARCTIPRLAFTAGDTRLIIPLLFHPVAANKTLSVEDGALVAIYGSAKYIGANAVSALDENGTAVPWLDEVAAAIDFQFPRSDLEAASNTVVGSWIISVALSSLGITNAPSLNLTAVPR